MKLSLGRKLRIGIMSVAIAGAVVSGIDCAPEIFTGSPKLLSLSILQNEEVEGLFDTGGAAVTITAQPTQGTLLVDGFDWTYQADWRASGTDSFSYQYTDSRGELIRRKVVFPISPVPSGTTTYTEAYTGGVKQLPGWKSRNSTFGLGFERAFETETINTIAGKDVYRMTVKGDASDGFNTITSDQFYIDRGYGVPPRDGTSGLGPGQWPWSMELIHRPECIKDVTITARIRDTTTTAGTPAPSSVAYGVLLNYKVRGKGATQKLTGYQVLNNGGGASTTLSRFQDAGEHATDYMDQWPGYSCCGGIPNPVVLGPYKGWDYNSGVHPAGGSPDASVKEKVLVGRYQYDTTSGDVSISWEVRPVAGTDGDVGFSFSQVVSGADAIGPGGDFGVFVLNMRGYSQFDSDTPHDRGIQIADVQLDCVN